MGQAKRNREQLRKEVIKGIDDWSFPETEWETETVAEIEKLPVIRVRRYPDEALEYMRMIPKQCHANAKFMQENDPDGICWQVSGWWIQEGNYVLHSVVERAGEFFCVTPVPMDSDYKFDFIPDPKIEWREEGEYRNSYRDNVEIGVGLRSDPKRTLKRNSIMKDRLLSGMNPYKALSSPIKEEE